MNRNVQKNPPYLLPFRTLMIRCSGSKFGWFLNFYYGISFSSRKCRWWTRFDRWANDKCICRTFRDMKSFFGLLLQKGLHMRKSHSPYFWWRNRQIDRRIHGNHAAGMFYCRNRNSHRFRSRFHHHPRCSSELTQFQLIFCDLESNKTV